MKIPFSKMHGLGNDFVVIDARKLPNTNWREHSPAILDRRLGVGADQLLIIEASLVADFRMLIFERDGLQTEMCGNGIRALARYWNESVEPKKEVRVETLVGIKGVQYFSPDKIRVDMGKPTFSKAQMWGEPITAGTDHPKVHVVSMGNPHAVIFVDHEKDLNAVTKLGPELEYHPKFPNRTNVELVYPDSNQSVRVRVWERGAGETWACGTGACASGVASIATGRVQSPVTIRFKGGNLTIEWSEGESVFMTGPAKRVFDGELNL